jgi:nitroreductase
LLGREGAVAIDVTPGDDREPRPRGDALPHAERPWPVVRSWTLRAVVAPGPVDFGEVLEARSSIRHLTQAPLREVANLMAFATGARAVWGCAPQRSLRPAHSAGAIHPVTALLVRVGPSPRIFRLAPFEARLELLALEEKWRLVDLIAEVRRIVPAAKADLLVLAADPARVRAVYEREAALVWRDAGAVMQTMHLCATALRLGFCPVGIGGDDALAAVFGEGHGLLGAGVAAVGRAQARGGEGDP